MNPGLELNSRHDGEVNEKPGCLMQLAFQRLLLVLPGSLKGPV